MFSRGNKGKDKLNEQVTPQEQTEEVTRQTMSTEEFLAQNEDAKKIYEDILSLRKSVENLRNDDLSIEVEPAQEVSGQDVKKDIYLEDTEEIIAAKQAIIEQAKRDAEKERLRQEELRRKELEAQRVQEEIRRAEIRAALIEEEAERKRKEAAEAERRAKEISRKKALEDMEAEMQARNAELYKEPEESSVREA